MLSHPAHAFGNRFLPPLSNRTVAAFLCAAPGKASHFI
jgi:hypothetical protein